tara:strand:- start:3122 stop:3793 length:672 start_codon:yes stop_codon:yes gene_type:complete
MKNKLAENMLRFGTKNLTESDMQQLNENNPFSKGLSWANQQKDVKKILDNYYLGGTPNGDGKGIWPVPTIAMGPYILKITQTENPVPNGTPFVGEIYALRQNNGVMSLTLGQATGVNETGYFRYHPANGFMDFQDDMRLLNYNDSSVNDSWKQPVSAASKYVTGDTFKNMFTQFNSVLPAANQQKLAAKLQQFKQDPASRSEIQGRAKTWNIIYAGMTTQTPG